MGEGRYTYRRGGTGRGRDTCRGGGTERGVDRDKEGEWTVQTGEEVQAVGRYRRERRYNIDRGGGTDGKGGTI